jgi:hypothetical protein
VLDPLSIRSGFAQTATQPVASLRPNPSVQHYVRTAEIFNTHHSSSVAEVPFAPTLSVNSAIYTPLSCVEFSREIRRDIMNVTSHMPPINAHGAIP